MIHSTFQCQYSLGFQCSGSILQIWILNSFLITPMASLIFLPDFFQSAYGTSLPDLFVSNHQIEIAFVGENLSHILEDIVVDGVRLVSPNINIGRNLVVHGVDDALNAGTISDTFNDYALSGGDFVHPPIWIPEPHSPIQSPPPTYVVELIAPASALIEDFSPHTGQLSPYLMSPFQFDYPFISVSSGFVNQSVVFPTKLVAYFCSESLFHHSLQLSVVFKVSFISIALFAQVAALLVHRYD